MNTKFIPLSVPNFEGNEEKYVNDAVKSTWVSTGGGYVTSFEEKLAEYAGLHRTYIGMIERFERNITLINAEKVAHALGVNISELIK